MCSAAYLRGALDATSGTRSATRLDTAFVSTKDMSRIPSITYSDWSKAAAKHWAPRMVTVRAGHWARMELQ